MDYLPLFVRLQDEPVLVIGGGEVAARKISLLCRAGAKVRIVSPELSDETRQLVTEHGLEASARTYQPNDIVGMRLVVSATDDEQVNAGIYEDCVAAGVPINSVDRPAFSNVIFPSIVDRSPILVAVSTGGASPTMARVIRGWLEARLPARLGALAEFVRERRDQAAESDFEAALKVQETGWVAIVGAGPGDPELLTLKALRMIQSADVILYDNLVNRQILDYARRDAEQVYVGKKWRAPSTRQEAINQLMRDEALAGKAVVRLKGGDPFIFGRGGEEVEAMLEAGVDVVAVPGITAASGSASYAGIPLTYREVAQSVRFVTGHRAENRINLDWPELAHAGQTVVLYMGLSGIEEIFASLIEHGRSPNTPAALVEKATYPEQRVVVGTLSNLAAKVRAAEIKGPTTIVVGEVVAHRLRS